MEDSDAHNRTSPASRDLKPGSSETDSHELDMSTPDVCSETEIPDLHAGGAREQRDDDTPDGDCEVFPSQSLVSTEGMPPPTPADSEDSDAGKIVDTENVDNGDSSRGQGVSQPAQVTHDHRNTDTMISRSDDNHDPVITTNKAWELDNQTIENSEYNCINGDDDNNNILSKPNTTPYDGNLNDKTENRLSPFRPTNSSATDTTACEPVTPISQGLKAKPASDPQLYINPVTLSVSPTGRSNPTDKIPEPLSERGAISDNLPETPHPGILHTGNHPAHSSRAKKLKFQVPPRKGKSQSSSSSKSIPRSFSLPAALSKLMHKHAKNPEQLTRPVKTVVVETPPRAEEQKGDKLDGMKDCCSRRCSCCSPLKERVRRWWFRDASIEGKEIRNTLAVGVAFQLIFTAHFAIQNLQSSLHEEEYLGVSALGCLYAASIFSSIFSPTIIGVLGLKCCLVLAWLTHILYTLAQFYPAWETLVPASILLGALAGPTWTAQGVYVSACAFSFSKRSPHSPYTILSRFNGLFFTLYETRQILGNLLSSVVLRDGMGNKSEEIIFKFCGPRDCPSAENVTDIEEPDRMVINSMLGIYMALQVLALVLTVLLVTPLARSEWSSRAPIRQTVTSWFRTLVGTRMTFFVPLMIFQAMEQGILLSEYTKSYISCPIGIHRVGFVMATHGATTAVFVFVFSRLARRTGRFPLLALASVLSLALLVLLYDWTPDVNQEAPIFLFPVLWGVAEGIWQTQTNSMIAVTFWNRKEPAFANYHTWRAVGFTLVFSFHSVLCVSTKIAVALAFLVVGMVLYTGAEAYARRKERARFGLQDTEIKIEKVEVAKEGADANKDGGEEGDGGRGCAGGEVQVGVGVGVGVSHPPGEEPGGTLSRLSSHLSFDTAPDDLEMTLDGTYLTRGETAFLDNDLKRYGVVPTGGSRPLTVASMTSPASLARSSSDDSTTAGEKWVVGDQEEVWSGAATNQRVSSRPHERSFQDEGELQVVWTKNDVLVY